MKYLRLMPQAWGLLGGDEEAVGGFVDFDVAGEGVVAGALAREWVDVGEVFESFYRI